MTTRGPRLTDQFGNPLSAPVPNYRAEPQSKYDPVRESIVDVDGGFNIVRSQDCDATIQAVHEFSTNSNKRSKTDGTRYIGSAPLIVAEIWAKECGAPVGTREFANYAHKKLYGGEYSKLKVHL